MLVQYMLTDRASFPIALLNSQSFVTPTVSMANLAAESSSSPLNLFQSELADIKLG